MSTGLGWRNNVPAKRCSVLRDRTGESRLSRASMKLENRIMANID